MSLVFTEGFDLYNSTATVASLGGWTTVGGSSLVAGRIAGSAFSQNPGGGGTLGLSKPLANLASVVVGVAWRIDTLGAITPRIVGFSESGTEQMSIRLDATGTKIVVTRNGTVPLRNVSNHGCQHLVLL